MPRPEATRSFAPGEFGGERIHPLVPEPAEVVHPVVELAERRGIDRVEPARALRADGGEAALAQDLQVLRDGRLRDPELRLDDRRDRARRDLAIGEQLEDPAPNGVAQDVERVHGPILEYATYISQPCYLAMPAGRVARPKATSDAVAMNASTTLPSIAAVRPIVTDMKPIAGG